MRKQGLRCLILVLALAFLAGCQASSDGQAAATALVSTAAVPTDLPPTPTQPAGQVAGPAEALTTPEFPSPTETPLTAFDPTRVPPDAPALLSASGPWLLFLAAELEKEPTYLWAANSDGTGLTRISERPALNLAVRPNRLPDGRVLIATISSSPASSYQDLALYLITLPDRTETRVTLLTSAETGLPLDEPRPNPDLEDNRFDMAAAISHSDSLRWSPDGAWLAFTGAMDGKSVDLYSYELATGVIRWLTDGPSHAYQILWSADSQQIIHSARDYFLGAGGPYEPGEGTWSAAPDGSGVLALEGPAPAHFVGWLDDDTLLLDSGPRNVCMTDMRLLHLDTVQVDDLGVDCFEAAIYSLDARAVLFTTHGSTPPLDEAGLYLLNIDSQTVTQVGEVDRGIWDGWWDGAEQRFVIPSVGAEPFGVTLAGDVVAVDDLRTVTSPDGRHQALYAPGSLPGGLLVKNGAERPVQLLDDPGLALKWAPDSRGVFYVTGRRELYAVSIQPLDVVKLSQDLWPNESFVAPHPYVWFAQWTP